MYLKGRIERGWVESWGRSKTKLILSPDVPLRQSHLWTVMFALHYLWSALSQQGQQLAARFAVCVCDWTTAGGWISKFSLEQGPRYHKYIICAIRAWRSTCYENIVASVFIQRFLEACFKLQTIGKLHSTDSFLRIWYLSRQVTVWRILSSGTHSIVQYTFTSSHWWWRRQAPIKARSLSTKLHRAES